MDDVLRRRRKISASTWSLARAGLDGVIPFRMERVTLDIEGRHFGVGDFDALFVGAGIELTADRETRLGRQLVAYPVVPGDCHDGLGENLEGR